MQELKQTGLYIIRQIVIFGVVIMLCSAGMNLDLSPEVANATPVESSQTNDSNESNSENTQTEQANAAGSVSNPDFDEIAETRIYEEIPAAGAEDDQNISILRYFGSIDYVKETKASPDRYGNSTMDERSHANAFLDYFRTNFKEYAKESGSEEISAAATDANLTTLRMIASYKVIPSSEEQQSIENGQEITTGIDNSEIKTGNYYILIHESSKRAGSYDIIAAKAQMDGKLRFKLQDLNVLSLVELTLNAGPGTAYAAGDEATSGEELMADTGLIEASDADSETVEFQAIDTSEEEAETSPLDIIYMIATKVFVISLSLLVVYILNQKGIIDIAGLLERLPLERIRAFNPLRWRENW